MDLGTNRVTCIFRLLFLSLLVLTACQANQAQTSTQTPASKGSPTLTPDLPTATPTVLTSTQDPSETTTSTPKSSPPPYSALCSPLEGEDLDALGRPDLLKNPFQPPGRGQDNGHFGVDFSYWSRADGTSMAGLPIYSVLDGVVASAIENRQPYGNALIIETPLSQIDPHWLDLLPIQIYDPNAPLQPSTSLTCPAYEFTPQRTPLSLYLLYAHMRQPGQLTQGSQVICGQQIGQVGTTGNSVNDHLHLETRIGPSGIKFASLAHYDTSATREEMRNYCLWRISGAFMPFDPMALLSIR